VVCLRYSLSYRDLEEMMAERGLAMTTLRFGAGFSITHPFLINGFAVSATAESILAGR